MLFDVHLVLCFIRPTASRGLNLAHTCRSLKGKPNHSGGFLVFAPRKASIPPHWLGAIHSGVFLQQPQHMRVDQ
ncbi:uncharacterized protein MRET_2829 [Malassezia restricta]|uniref:uncharacterized protein n=1 Tax=Malassezia restricta TaxID=76775 RepID=UPI000DD10A30|nr:uncharacterized protein MRET_2829 [Malassezia restricta]AXA51316.1 uncharacterized protein MRET_2829 [Malassezia restricta]